MTEQRKDIRIVVCAAVRCDQTQMVVCGVRHYDQLMHSVLQHKPEGTFDPSKTTQGFVDNKYNFLTRTEAWVIAEQQGQIIKRVGNDHVNGGTLYSENLY